MKTQYAAVHEPAVGTTRTSRNVRAMSVIEGISGVRCSSREPQFHPVGYQTQVENFYHVAKKATHPRHEPATMSADDANRSGDLAQPDKRPR